MNNEVKGILLEEFDITREALSISYEDVYKMSVYKRKFYLGEKLKQIEKQQNTTKKSGRNKK